MNKCIFSEHRTADYVCYVFNENSGFNETVYKGIKTNNGLNILECNQIFVDGNIAIMYLLNGKCSFEVAAQMLNTSTYATLIYNIISSFIDMKNLSFFKYDNLLIDAADIFVDINTLKPSFIYIPIDTDEDTEIYYIKQKYIRNIMVQHLSINDNLKSSLGMELINELKNMRSTIETLKDNISWLIGNHTEDTTDNNEILYSYKANKIMNNEKTGLNKKAKDAGIYADTTILSSGFVPSIVLINKEKRSKYIVDSDKYIIGHIDGECSLCLHEYSNVSKRHCVITQIDCRNYITDMRSTNGTYVNGKQIMPGNKIEIMPGDNIKIADLELMVANIT